MTSGVRGKPLRGCKTAWPGQRQCKNQARGCVRARIGELIHPIRDEEKRFQVGRGPPN